MMPGASTVNRRSAHYDVFSIARGAGGECFDSCKSVERMATAAFNAAGRSMDDRKKLTSDTPAEHNPLGVGILLVKGSRRSLDRRVLAPRLGSLGARLISLVERHKKAKSGWRDSGLSVKFSKVLLRPLAWKRLQHARHRQLRPLLPVQDRLDDVGREQCQTQDAGHVGRRDPLPLGQFGD